MAVIAVTVASVVTVRGGAGLGGNVFGLSRDGQWGRGVGGVSMRVVGVCVCGKGRLGEVMGTR